MIHLVHSSIGEVWINPSHVVTVQRNATSPYVFTVTLVTGQAIDITTGEHAHRAIEKFLKLVK